MWRRLNWQLILLVKLIMLLALLEFIREYRAVAAADALKQDPAHRKVWREIVLAQELAAQKMEDGIAWDRAKGAKSADKMSSPTHNIRARVTQFRFRRLLGGPLQEED